MRLAACGLALALLPERGLDVAEAWLDGVQLAWLSGSGFHGVEWGGGLLTTCGLQNVGAASEGFPLHGRYHRRPVQLLDRGPSHVRALARDGPFRLERELSVEAGSLSLLDVTENVGLRTEQAPVLYHVNIGPALWSDGGGVVVHGLREVVPRDADAEAGRASWSVPPEPANVPERVFEHLFEPAGGWGAVTVRNGRAGLELELRWRTAELPRLHQWVDPKPGYEGFALEPANCSVLGREADRAAGGAPTLDPGESRETRLEIRASRLSG